MAVCTACLAVAGCDTGDEAGPEEQAQATVETFLASCAEGDVVAAELTLTEPQRAMFIRAGEELDGCLTVVEIEPPGDLSPEEVQALFDAAGTTSVHVDGGFAHVGVETPDHRRTLELEQLRGRWLIASAAVGLPPE